MIAALLLAAGRSSRFGGDKLTALLGGEPVVRRSARALVALVDAVYVVVPPDALAVRGALAPLNLRFVEHAGRDAGMASSIRAGVLALPAGTEAVLIALGDQPLLSGSVALRVVERWRATGARAVVPCYRDGRGHPVLFARDCFTALRALEGDTGARAVLDALGDAVEVVPVDEPMPLDVDTPEALREAEQMLGPER